VFSFLLEKSIMDGVYVHLFGQMSFWGATVITNLLSPFPSLIEWLCGGQISKDFYGNILILYLYLLQTHFGFSSFSHPDNALEACGLLTPLHIVPEWYFLCQYAMLKAVPNKNAGFIILFTSIFTFFYFMRSVSMSYYFIVFTCSRFNGIYLSFWFLSLLSFVWIGGQFPQDNFLSYGRILTLHYYFLLICILFSISQP
jgi:quinol-cytochrome oxidoreductase complex cytochrome b subunit